MLFVSKEMKTLATVLRKEFWNHRVFPKIETPAYFKETPLCENLRGLKIDWVFQISDLAVK